MAFHFFLQSPDQCQIQSSCEADPCLLLCVGVGVPSFDEDPIKVPVCDCRFSSYVVLSAPRCFMCLYIQLGAVGMRGKKSKTTSIAVVRYHLSQNLATPGSFFLFLVFGVMVVSFPSAVSQLPLRHVKAPS